MAAELTPMYRAAMTVMAPVVRVWGRLEVAGLEELPATGPVLLAGNHDSYWDPIAIGMAAQSRRQIHALAKAQLWDIKGLSPVLNGMAQIPIDRGKGDAGALETAIRRLREGACIGVFPEGTRSRGRQLRARSGFGRLAEAVPEADVVLCSCIGTTDVIDFPKHPRIRVRFFRPERGGLQPGEGHAEFSARLLAEIRREAPIAHPRRRPPKPQD